MIFCKIKCAATLYMSMFVYPCDFLIFAFINAVIIVLSKSYCLTIYIFYFNYGNKIHYLIEKILMSMVGFPHIECEHQNFFYAYFRLG